MLLIYNNPDALQSLPQDEMQRIMDDVGALMSDLRERGEFLGGDALAHPSQTKTVRVRDGDPLELSTSMVQGRWLMVGGTMLLFTLIADIPAFMVAAGISVVSEAVNGALPGAAPVLEIASDWLARMGENLATALALSMFYGLMRTDERTLPPIWWTES